MSNLPPHIKKLEHIKELLTHPAVDQVEIYRRVKKVFEEVGYVRHPFRFEIGMLCRAAAKNDQAWFNFSDGNPDVDRLHCPPAGKPELGRCNWAGESVFYCSSENGVPVFEVRSTLNQYVVVSSWMDKSNRMNPASTPVTITGVAIGVKKLVESIKPDQPLRTLLLKDDIFRTDTPAAIKEVDEYIGDLFTKSKEEIPSLYTFTSAITHVLFHDIGHQSTRSKLEGLIYPSVESRFSGHNVVLTEQFARNQLKLVGAVMYQVVEHNPAQSSYSLKPLKGLGNNPVDGSPIWRKIHSKHDAARFVLSPDTQTVAYQENNVLSYEDEE